MSEISNVISIKGSLDGSFFRQWIEFLRPLHNLTNREMDIVALFLKHRYELGNVISNQEVLDEVLMSNKTKKAIVSEGGITFEHFKVIMSKLRQHNVIVDEKINKKLVPHIDKDSDSASLLVSFNLKNEQHIKLGNYQSRP